MGSVAVILKGMFWQEQRSGRVIMGYLLGLCNHGLLDERFPAVCG